MGEEQRFIGLIIGILVILIALIVLSAYFKTFGKIMGVIFLVPGLAALVYGVVRANSFESQITRTFGGNDEVMLACFILGGISAVLGIILLIIGFSGTKKPITYNYNQAPVNYSQVPTNYNQTPTNYNQTPTNYNQSPETYNQSPETYEQAPVENNTNRYIVKVRCAKCQSLNHETSNFCNVCANPMGNQKIEI